MTLAAPEKTRTVTDTAARLLADTFRTSLMAHNFHWNVTGPMFGTLHERFELIYTELDQAIDEIAERIRTLGAPAPGSFEAYGKLSRVDDPKATAPESMIREMVAALETTAGTARALVDAATSVDDPVSADLGTRRADVAEKSAWLLRSYLQ